MPRDKTVNFLLNAIRWKGWSISNSKLYRHQKDSAEGAHAKIKKHLNKMRELKNVQKSTYFQTCLEWQLQITSFNDNVWEIKQMDLWNTIMLL